MAERKYRDIFPKENLEDMNNVLWANGIYNRKDIEWYTKFRRFGGIDPYNAPLGTKEYLFFTKPDLHLVQHGTSILNPELANQPYFIELYKQYPEIISQLQQGSDMGFNTGPFMTILSNSVKNTLELQPITSEVIETAANIYGTAYNYRSWGYSSDEKIEFSLEFEDTKYLEVYNLIKAYEEYERLKHLGLVTPPNRDSTPTVNGKCFSYYIRNKILHDQFSIYKFIVDADGETIIYYAKLWGVFFKNVPREAFSDMKTEGGLTYAVEFEAAFVDDMNPTILGDFYKLVGEYDKDYALPIYNTDTRMIEGAWASSPKIVKEYVNRTWNGPKNMQYVYKLKWRK